MERQIITLGTDCTLLHGFKDFINYKNTEDGIEISPFAGTWIFDPSDKPGDWEMNYNSLGIIADLINTNFEGWHDLGVNFRGKCCMKKYPVEFTYGEILSDPKPVKLFYEKLRGNIPILFCSVWRTYIAFDKVNPEKVKSDIFTGLRKFEDVIKRVNPNINYESAFFFVIDRSHRQEQFIKNIMAESKIKYGILYNEVDENNIWRWARMLFDCNGWEKALKDTGII